MLQYKVFRLLQIQVHLSGVPSCTECITVTVTL